MNRALVMKIYPDKLEAKDWDGWKREDKEFMNKCMKDNGCTSNFNGVEGCIDIHGTPDQLFNFIHDVAWRYDIEII